MEFDITTLPKIGSITADNAANNCTMMRHLKVRFRTASVSFDHNGNCARYHSLFTQSQHAQYEINRCFLHVINLAVQAIYATLKDESNSDVQYLLGNLPEFTEEALQVMPLPDGVTIEEYRTALAADIIRVAWKLVMACRASGQRHEDFELTIYEGNKAGTWKDSKGNPLTLVVLQLLRDCET